MGINYEPGRSKTQDILIDQLTQLQLLNTNILASGVSSVSTNLAIKQGSRTIYVYSGASGNNDGTSLTDAYQTVEDALDDADTTRLCDVILIFDDPGGSGYDINRVTANAVWDSPMIIIGIGRRQVRIVNENAGSSYVMMFEDAVYIENICIIVEDSRQQDGIVIDGGWADGSEIYNCDFDLLNGSNGYKCLVLNELERIRVERSHFYISNDGVNLTEGIEVRESLRCEIRDNIFEANHPAAGGGRGVHFTTGGGACRQNYIMDNVFVGCDAGVLIDLNCNRNGVMRNYFKSCTADVTDNGANNYEMGSVTQV